jgi:peptidoglycan/xylan/chitin deacetylase (PgdA/CDA1 family)
VKAIHRTIRSNAAPVAKTMLLNSGAYSALRRMLPSRRLAILRYHAVCEPDAGYATPGICVSPGAFEQHVAYLAANYHVLSLPDAIASLQRGSTIPRNAVVITFDDGYADNLGAARALQRHGLTATFYLTAGCLAEGAPFWPAELRGLVTAIKQPMVELRLHGETVTIPVPDEQARMAAISRLTKMFKSQSIPVRESLRDQLRTLAGPVEAASPMLSWEQVVEMHQMGMVIGSHTMTHPNLPSAGPADAWREISESKARLERELGVPVTMFSYPNGGAERYFTSEIVRFVKDAGFSAATTSTNGFAGPESDLFELERVQVQERLEDLVFALEVERFAFKPTERVQPT